MKNTLLLFVLFVISCTPSPPEESKIEDVFSPAGPKSEEPSFFKTQDGIGLTWLEKSGEEAVLKYVVYKNSNWTEPKTLISGAKVLANWADFPGIQTNGTHWIAWFLQINNPDFFAYDVMVMQSSDNGDTWTEPQKLHSDSTLTEHGFVSAEPADNGFQLIWLDGRYATDMSGNFTMRSAFLDFNGTVSARKILDDNTCTCCQTSLVKNGDDNFIALYRDRTEEEIRDIVTVSFNTPDLSKKPQLLHEDNWNIAGCPVNGPRAIASNNEIGAVWFTMGTDGVAKVLFATSDDDGKNYSTPLLIDTDNLGRVDILTTDGAYYISYMDKTENGAEIKIAEIVKNKIVNTHSITQISSSRKTGFPRMALLPDGIFIAYTDVESDKIELKFLSF